MMAGRLPGAANRTCKPEASHPYQGREASVADEQKLKQLFSELERVGVDPHTLSAGLGVRSDEALRVLRALPDGAGPAAFLSRLRQDATLRASTHH